MSQTSDESYSIAQIIKLRNRLFEQVGGTFLGQEMTGAAYQRMVQLFLDIMPASVAATAVCDSLRHLAGQPLLKETFHDTCHRLAGNLPALRRGMAVPPWQVQRLPEWVPLFIMHARRARNHKDDYGVLLQLKIMAGSPCPLIIQKFWTLRFCRFVSLDFGFSKRPGIRSQLPMRYPFSTGEQLVTLRFSGLIDPELSSAQDGPMFGQVRMDAPLLKWNRERLRHRFRVDEGYTCPEGYEQDFPCQQCHHGYLTSCQAATHPYEWVFKVCPRCHEEGPFDDFVSRDTCVVCYNESLTRRKD